MRHFQYSFDFFTENEKEHLGICCACVHFTPSFNSYDHDGCAARDLERVIAMIESHQYGSVDLSDVLSMKMESIEEVRVSNKQCEYFVEWGTE